MRKNHIHHIGVDCQYKNYRIWTIIIMYWWKFLMLLCAWWYCVRPSITFDDGWYDIEYLCVWLVMRWIDSVASEVEWCVSVHNYCLSICWEWIERVVLRSTVTVVYFAVQCELVHCLWVWMWLFCGVKWVGALFVRMNLDIFSAMWVGVLLVGSSGKHHRFWPVTICLFRACII